MKKVSGILKLLSLIVTVMNLLSCTAAGDNREGNKKASRDTIPVNATNAPTQLAVIDGRTLAYRSVGSGEPIILCQRFRGNLDDWDPLFIDELAKEYRVITFDYTGLGTSTGHTPNNMTGFAKDVADLAKALRLNKFIIGGWSFGGWVAQIVTTEFPDLISQTILIGTRPPGKFDHPFEDIFFQTALKPSNDFADEIILFFEPTSAFSRDAAKRSHDRIAKRTGKDSLVKVEQLHFYSEAGTDYTNDPYHARQKMMKTTIPILVISGDHEICFPPQNWFDMNRTLPTTQVVVIPQSGHAPHHQYPEMTASYIKTFLGNNKKYLLAN